VLDPFEIKVEFTSVNNELIPIVEKSYIKDLMTFAEKVKKKIPNHELYLSQIFLSDKFVIETAVIEAFQVVMKEMALRLLSISTRQSYPVRTISIVKYRTKQDNEEGWTYVFFVQIY